MKEKVLVGMSGGVDSSMSAYLLQKEGYEVIGVYMKLHNLKEGYHEKNIELGQSVADYLKIDYHVADFTEKFKEEVYNYFIQSYKDGNTPNPCVKCNRLIKFGALYDFGKSLGVNKLATGHYVKTDGEFIYEAEDDRKDQSYFLAQLKQDVLKSLVFPMANYKKEDIVKMAKDLPIIDNVALQGESQEICFVETTYTDILKKHYDIEKEGKVLNNEGKVIGHHKGYMHYTIGKRRGFHVKGAKEPHFVKEIEPSRNVITVSSKNELEINRVVLDTLNLFNNEKEFTCQVKLRYRSDKIECKVKVEDSKANIDLVESAYGVATGQVAVFYEDEKVLGSGFIIQASK
ncbi:MAG: tRNA 2-thiouridine(34) synthase MnmA [Campylobacterales bacterium]|nr:tRNA 2-thiouridine(34) synthase MnmA [Campylobacterales bacterium]